MFSDTADERAGSLTNITRMTSSAFNEVNDMIDRTIQTMQNGITDVHVTDNARVETELTDSTITRVKTRAPFSRRAFSSVVNLAKGSTNFRPGKALLPPLRRDEKLSLVKVLKGGAKGAETIKLTKKDVAKDVWRMVGIWRKGAKRVSLLEMNRMRNIAITLGQVEIEESD